MYIIVNSTDLLCHKLSLKNTKTLVSCRSCSLITVQRDNLKPPDFWKLTNPKYLIGLPWWLSGEEPTCQCRRCGFNPWVRKIPWRRRCQPTPVCLPGKSNGQRNLAGYSPWGHKRVGHNLATKQQQQIPHGVTFMVNKC